MKFSLEWLKYFLDTDASVDEVAAKLNAIGFEVEGIDDPARKLEGFVVAEVMTAAPHPQADKLQVLTVNTGSGEPLQVVCGAPNSCPVMWIRDDIAILPPMGMVRRRPACGRAGTAATFVSPTRRWSECARCHQGSSNCS